MCEFLHGSSKTAAKDEDDDDGENKLPPSTDPPLNPLSSFHLLPRKRHRPGSAPSASGGPSGVGPYREAICQNTSYPSFCISTLTPFPSEMDNTHVILAMVVNATLNSTQVALAEAKRLLSDPSTPSLYNSSLQVCQDRYTVAIQELQAVVQHIANGVEDIADWLQEAQYCFVQCEIQYVEMDLSARDAGEYDAFVSWLPEVFLPFKLSDMVDNCLDITKLIHWPPAH